MRHQEAAISLNQLNSRIYTHVTERTRVKKGLTNQTLDRCRLANRDAWHSRSLPAGPTFEGAVPAMAPRAVRLAVLLAGTLTDEAKQDLHVLVEAQGLDLDGVLLVVLQAFLCCDIDGESHLEAEICEGQNT